jgi:hypothetical protein
MDGLTAGLLNITEHTYVKGILKYTYLKGNHFKKTSETLDGLWILESEHTMIQ